METRKDIALKFVASVIIGGLFGLIVGEISAMSMIELSITPPFSIVRAIIINIPVMKQVFGVSFFLLSIALCKRKKSVTLN
jgi:hypothetical protein